MTNDTPHTLTVKAVRTSTYTVPVPDGFDLTDDDAVHELVMAGIAGEETDGTTDSVIAWDDDTDGQVY